MFVNNYKSKIMDIINENTECIKVKNTLKESLESV